MLLADKNIRPLHYKLAVNYSAKFLKQKVYYQPGSRCTDSRKVNSEIIAS